MMTSYHHCTDNILNIELLSLTLGRDRLCLILWHVVMPPIACGQTWLDANSCRCQLCQTLGGIYLTVTIEDMMKKINLIYKCFSCDAPLNGHCCKILYNICCNKKFCSNNYDYYFAGYGCHEKSSITLTSQGRGGLIARVSASTFTSTNSKAKGNQLLCLPPLNMSESKSVVCSQTKAVLALLRSQIAHWCSCVTIGNLVYLTYVTIGNLVYLTLVTVGNRDTAALSATRAIRRFIQNVPLRTVEMVIVIAGTKVENKQVWSRPNLYRLSVFICVLLLPVCKWTLERTTQKFSSALRQWTISNCLFVCCICYVEETSRYYCYKQYIAVT